MKTKFFTCLTSKYRPGDIIVGRSVPHPPAKGAVLYMNTSPHPHFTLSFQERLGYMYQVVPQGKVWYGKNFMEAMTTKALVVKCLGRAENFRHTKDMDRVFVRRVPRN